MKKMQNVFNNILILKVIFLKNEVSYKKKISLYYI